MRAKGSSYFFTGPYPAVYLELVASFMGLEPASVLERSLHEHGIPIIPPAPK